MSFDQSTRNRLARFVADARGLLTQEFTRQLQNDYGLDPERGTVTDLARLGHLDDQRRETATILRATLEHYLAGNPKPTAKARQDALERIVREQAFTVLNRLAALRMAEARELLLESVGQGYRSRGFQLYARLAGPALGETGDAYRSYLFSLFDEFAVDLAVLFDRFSPQGRLFPREAALLQLLELINHPEIEPLWGEDETIGWVYQYFNSQEERRQMRAESQAPRNSRELAVRNQFFTPRYVVEFLTDNTLGRIWYEMTEGRTQLAAECRYLVRRPREIFLGSLSISHDESGAWVRAALAGDFAALPETPPLEEIGQFALLLDGYDLAERFGYGDVLAYGSEQMRGYIKDGAALPGDSLELWLILFAYQRAYLRDGWQSTEENDPILRAIRAVYDSLRHALQNPPDDLSQEELLKQPVFIPHRPLKDPRDLKMLDPACGSMHFGLYAFDLFERIYEEAWELAANGQLSVSSDQSSVDALLITDNWSLITDYSSKEALLRDVPRLIIEHNIHGIDIDPRAVQIAGLSLWLRAQRSWHEQGVKADERPLIRRSNIVCAEPMPGDRALLEEFLAELREERLESLIRRVIAVPENQRVRATPSMADALAELVRTVWAEMELAGEAGSLLKIEGSLAAAIERGRAEWDQRLPLFRVETFRMTGAAEGERPAVSYPRTMPDGGDDFWERAEALVLAALESYAQRAESGRSYARRLFAGDAARGFAFIDLCRKRYDVVLMNPPFGAVSHPSKRTLLSAYPFTSNDLYAMFTQRGVEVSVDAGMIGAITSRTGFFLSSFELWRTQVISILSAPTVVADLGMGVLDSAMVETAAYCLQKNNSSASMFFRVLSDGDKDVALLKMVSASAQGFWNSSVYTAQVKTFSSLPGAPFAYWVTGSFRTQLSGLSRFESDTRRARRGPSSGDDTRRLRAWWEVNAGDVGRHRIWVPYPKGGSLSPYYAVYPLVISWSESRRTFRDFCGRPGREIERPECLEDFFYPGLTWPRRTSRFAPSIMPAGCIFSVRGQAILDDSDDFLFTLGMTNSRVFDFIFKLSLGRFEYPEFISGILQKLPWAQPNNVQRDLIARSALTIFNTRRSEDTTNDIGHFFCLPTLIQFTGTTLGSRFEKWISWLNSNTDNVEVWQNEIDNLAYEIYGVSETDRIVIEQTGSVVESDEGESKFQQDDDDEKSNLADLVSELSQVVVWTIGCDFGRWDIRYATGGKPQPELPAPFAPLPVCPPGMLQNAAGLPASPGDIPADYPLRISWPGILVDDPGHPEDVEGRVREALRVIWPDNADAIEQEACQILGVESLRAWFASPNSFFDDHLKRYSKSRRAAPIYWPLSTPSGSYTLWLYYHRLTDQSLYLCVNDFVEPKLKVIGEQLSVSRNRSSRSAQEERELERLADLERELIDFRDELLRIARFWRPNLNDGVQITAAPLWRLFRHRAWSKRLQDTWEKLEAGEYDWAHLALSIWPARVVPQCVTDRSLAIAHDVEDLFWVEDGGTWRNLRSPEEEIAEQKRRLALSPARSQSRRLLGELAGGRGAGLSGAQVYALLASGDWDDLEVARLLWPERAAEKCWNNPLLAMDWQITLPGKSTKKAQRDFFAQLTADGCPEVADLLAGVLAQEDASFSAVWSRLSAGEMDDTPLALSLWPERVLAKCLEDAALAGVHEVRGFFWVEGPGGVWRRRVGVGEEVKGEVERRQ